MGDSLPTNAAAILATLTDHDADKVELANQTDLSPSTVKDHIATLRDHGHDINYDRTVQKYTLGETAATRRAEEVDHDTAAELLDGNGATRKDLADELDLSVDSVDTLLRDMRQAGYTLEFREVDAQGTRRWFIPDDIDRRYRIADGDGHYRFAIISDTHLGSSAEHLQELHDFYDRCADRGITDVFHAGDIGDGWEVHKGHINVIKGQAAGWEALREYIVENYPRRDGITTHFIEGNHDHKLYKRNGVRFGEWLAHRRDDLHYCGDSQATFIFDREHDIDLELLHPSGGKPYTVGYRLQTLYRERSLKDRPTIAAIGHLHGSMYAETEGVKGLYAGAWKGTTTYGKRKGHEARIGGWIIDMDIRDGVITQFVPQWQGYQEQGTANSYDVEDIRDE